MKEIFVIGGIEMSLPFILGAGVAKHPSSILPYLHPTAQVGAVISGSYTEDPREGNRGELAWPVGYGDLLKNGFGLNAYGMPNIGIDEAIVQFPEHPTKPHIVSIAGFKASEYVDMLELLKMSRHIAGVEINGGCPNTGHLPVAYALDDLAHLLEAIARVHFGKPIWLKLSPYMTQRELEDFAQLHPGLDFSSTPTVDPFFLDDLCELLIEHAGTIKAVVMTNTLPNVNYNNVITVRNSDGSVHHKGGLSGPIILGHNLTLIQGMVNCEVNLHMDIIGCGGILSGNDALAYLKAGCTAVACTSGPSWFGNPRFFSDLLEGSEELQEFICSM